MKATFEQKIDHQLKINFDVIKGEVDLETIIQHEKERLQSDKFDENFNTLVDIRGTEFVNFLSDIGKFCEFLDRYTKEANINMARKCAIVTSSPVEAVNSTIFALDFGKRENSFKFKSFSTEEAAIDWLSY